MCVCVCAFVCQEKAVKSHITLLKVFVTGGEIGGTHRRRKILCLFCDIKNKCWMGFPGGAVVKNPPANAGDTGSSPGLGGSHMLRSN